MAATNSAKQLSIETAMFAGDLSCTKITDANAVIPASLADAPLLLSAGVKTLETGNETEHTLIQEEAKDSLELTPGENGFVTHYLINPSGVELHVSLPRDARYELFILQTDSGKNSITIDMNGEGSQAFVYGIAYGEEAEAIDNTVLVRHLVPRTLSRQQIRAMADEEAAINFQGNIKVINEAVQTDAEQLAKGLLLSDKASVHVEPWLEIATDDVKAAHGTSVGQLDPRMLFYLQSRGIKEEQAVAMLQRAFFHEITEHIPDETMKTYFEERL